jgi:hypothetical protein
MLLAATATTALAAGSGRTAAGNAQARGELLTRADLGGGWRGGGLARSVPPITCSSFNPQLLTERETGAAATGRFRQSSTGPFVSQAAYVYATSAQGAAVARAVMRAKLLRCVADSLVAASGGGVKYAVTHRRLLTLPGVGIRAAGYRVAGTATLSGTSTDVYLDALVLANGQSVTEVSLATFYGPPSRALELRLARTIAHRVR